MQTLVPMLIIISTKCERSLSLSVRAAPQPSLNHMTRIAAATSKGPYYLEKVPYKKTQ
jgi:hypothetical protein